MAEFARIVEAGPDREKDGVVRWRRVDLKRVIAETFGVDFHERHVGTLLKKLGFSRWQRFETRGGCEDRGHGPPDASRLGSPLQRLRS